MKENYTPASSTSSGLIERTKKRVTGTKHGWALGAPTWSGAQHTWCSLNFPLVGPPLSSPLLHILPLISQLSSWLPRENSLRTHPSLIVSSLHSQVLLPTEFISVPLPLPLLVPAPRDLHPLGEAEPGSLRGLSQQPMRWPGPFHFPIPLSTTLYPQSLPYLFSSFTSNFMKIWSRPVTSLPNAPLTSQPSGVWHRSSAVSHSSILTQVTPTSVWLNSVFLALTGLAQ